MRSFILIFIIFLMCVGVNSQTLWNDQGHIPQAYQVEWTKAGLLSETPQLADSVYNIDDYGAVKDDGNDDYNFILVAVNVTKSTVGRTRVLKNWYFFV